MFINFCRCRNPLNSRLILDSFRPARTSLRRLFRLRDKSQLLKDLNIGGIHSDHLPCSAVNTCFLGPSQYRHDLLVCTVFQEICFVKSIYEPEGEHCRQEITEFTPGNGSIFLHTGFIELACRFIKPHDNFYHPELFISFICSFRREVQVALKYNGAKGLLFFPECLKSVSFAFLSSVKPIVFFFGCFITVSERIKPFIRSYALFFSEGDALISWKNAGKPQHIVPTNQLRITLDRIEVMKIIIGSEIFMRCGF